MSLPSFTKSFNLPFTLTGGDKKAVRYVLPLTPAPPPAGSAPTLFGALYDSALAVELVAVEVTLTMAPPAASDKSSLGAVGITTTSAAPETAAALARNRPVVFGGGAMSATLAEAVGVRRVLKGVLDLGGAPAVTVILSAGARDASSEVLGILTGRIEVRFTGDSEALSFQAPLPDPPRTAI